MTKRHSYMVRIHFEQPIKKRAGRFVTICPGLAAWIIPNRAHSGLLWHCFIDLVNTCLTQVIMVKGKKPVPFAAIESRIYLIQDTKVMLDADLARLYGVATKNLNKAVERNRDRFPSDFMFRLSAQEFADLRFQIGTSN
jgi:hypothetical protein